MFNKLQLIAFFLVLMFFANSASAQFVFQKSYNNLTNDRLNSIIQTQDGGFAAIGQSFSSINNNDIWFLKTNANGDIEFSKTYASPGIETGNSIKQLPNGDFVICGSTTTSTAATTSQIFIARLDLLGNIIWSKTYDAIKNEEANSLIINSNNEIVVAGLTTSVGIAYPKGLLLSTDLNGNLLWSTVYTQINTETFNKVIQTTDGGYLAVGGLVAFGNTNLDIIATKVDAAGNLQWSYSYGDLSDEEAFDVVQVGTDYFIAGYSASAGAGSRDFYLLRLASYGGILNGRVIGTGLSETAYDIHLYDPSTLVISGYSELSIAAPIREVSTLLKSDFNLNVFQALYLGDTMAQSRAVSSVVTNLGKVAMAGFYVQSGQTAINGFIAQNNLSYSQACNEYYPVVTPVAYIPNINPQNYSANAPLTEQNITFIASNTSSVTNSICFTTSVATAEKDIEINVTPNPVSESLSIQFKNNIENGDISIISITGQVLLKPNFNSLNKIDVSTLNPGIYFIQITTNSKKYYSKFIKA